MQDCQPDTIPHHWCLYSHSDGVCTTSEGGKKWYQSLINVREIFFPCSEKSPWWPKGLLHSSPRRKKDTDHDEKMGEKDLVCALATDIHTLLLPTSCPVHLAQIFPCPLTTHEIPTTNYALARSVAYTRVYLILMLLSGSSSDWLDAAFWQQCFLWTTTGLFWQLSCSCNSSKGL